MSQTQYRSRWPQRGPNPGGAAAAVIVRFLAVRYAFGLILLVDSRSITPRCPCVKKLVK